MIDKERLRKAKLSEIAVRHMIKEMIKTLGLTNKVSSYLFYCKRNKIKWTPLGDKINGDIFIYDSNCKVLYKIDVKCNWVSENSLDGFEGDFLLFVQSGNERKANCLIKHITALNYYETFRYVKPEILPSGDKGMSANHFMKPSFNFKMTAKEWAESNFKFRPKRPQL
jgi:hypothetical protein